eukprot:TRINITY_DN1981_c0_g1_i1.p1 TRINITY_DN1981_c0_g1~~TRINITY_DN1981_c0_g1_i1.p1  ORF type:complete len:245 (-),score=40.99 TRINITY_DN1981_c0_g1_i1:655-1389(-)
MGSKNSKTQSPFSLVQYPHSIPPSLSIPPSPSFSPPSLHSLPFPASPDRLYYVALRHSPKEPVKKKRIFFCIDDTLVYAPFFADFGPLNMACLYRFCRLMVSMLSNEDLKDTIIIYYSSINNQKRTNAAYLLGSYLILYHDYTAQQAYAPFKGIQPPFVAYRDASTSISTFHMTVSDCLHAIVRAKKCGFMDFENFDVDEYEKYEQVEEGDWNWIIPGKAIAFAGPKSKAEYDEDGIYTMTPGK